MGFCVSDSIEVRSLHKKFVFFFFQNIVVNRLVNSFCYGVCFENHFLTFFFLSELKAAVYQVGESLAAGDRVWTGTSGVSKLCGIH